MSVTSSLQVEAGQIAAIAEKVRGIHFTLAPECTGIKPTVVHLPAPTDTDDERRTAILRAQLGLLRLCTAESGAVASINITGYTVSQIVREVSGLPHWDCVLRLHDMHCGAKDTEYLMSLAKHVPTSYTRWAVDPGLGASHVMRLCMGVMSHGAADAGPLQLHWEGSTGVVMGTQLGRWVRFMPALSMAGAVVKAWDSDEEE